MESIDMQTLDKSLRETEVIQRKKYLIKQLHNRGIYQTTDGRRLEDVSLYTLEWVNIEAKNKKER